MMAYGDFEKMLLYYFTVFFGFLFVAGYTASAQKGAVSAGLTGAGEGGRFYASVGQVFFGSHMGSEGSEIQGIQQHYFYNPATGGSIAENDSICQGTAAETITNAALPQGALREVYYKWQYSITGDGDNYLDLSSSNAEAYDPGTPLQDTWFRRLALTSGFNQWSDAAVSNRVKITVVEPPVAIAGDDARINQGESFSLSKASAENYSAVLWETNGNGTFSDSLALNTIYQPAPGETGQVSLTLAVESILPCSGTDVSSIIIYIQTPGLWTGETSRDWHTPTNWDDEKVPSLENPVTIPNSINSPVIGSAASCKNLTIQNGGVLSVSNGRVLEISGHFILNEGAHLNNGGTLRFSGAQGKLFDYRSSKNSLGNLNVQYEK